MIIMINKFLTESKPVELSGFRKLHFLIAITGFQLSLTISLLKDFLAAQHFFEKTFIIVTFIVWILITISGIHTLFKRK